MNDLQIFKSEEFGEVRIVKINGLPFFVAKDVTSNLGYINSRKAIIDHVEEEDKDEVPIRDSIGRMQDTTVINESGLYSLILSSKLSTAKRFKKWVTSEILPSIREHGLYMTPETIEEALTNPDFIIQLATELKVEQSKRKLAEKTIEQMRPKEIFADAVCTSKTSILIGELAKLICQNGYEIGQNRLFQWMREKGYLMRDGESRNMPQQRYINSGLFDIKETNIQNPDGSVRITKTTKVTGKGQVYFINKFLTEKEV